MLMILYLGSPTCLNLLAAWRSESNRQLVPDLLIEE